MNNLFNEENSFLEKNNYSSNSNSSITSSNFLSEVNYNLTGGSQVSSAILDAFNQGKLDIALYLVDKICDNLNCAHPDYNGNTILHHLANYCSDERCVEVLKKILRKVDLPNFINMQNNKGETAILIATKKGNNIVADLLSKNGANGKIEDLAGNFVYTEDRGQGDTEFGFDSLNTDNKKISVITLFKDSPKFDLSSLNLNTPKSVNNSINPVSSNLLSSNDSFLTSINNKLKNRNFGDDSLDSSNFLASLKKNIFNKIPSKLQNVIGDTENEIEKLAIKYNDKKNSKENSIDDNYLENIIDQLRGNNVSKNLSPSSQKSMNSTTSPVNTFQRDNIGNFSSTSDYNKNNNLLLNFNNTDNTDKYNTIDSFDSDLLSSIFRKHGGGKKKSEYKISGNRKLNNKKFNYSNNSEEYATHNSDKSYKSPQNELSRLINSRKDELHKEVYNMILELLNRGELLQNNKPIDATERNARLIKTYLYRRVSEENPQYNGMDKILAIKKMSDTDIVNAIENLPDLDKYEKEIKESIDVKRKQRELTSSENKSSTVKTEKKEKSKKDKIKLSTTDSDKKSSTKKSSTKKTSAKKSKK